MDFNKLRKFLLLLFAVGLIVSCISDDETIIEEEPIEIVKDIDGNEYEVLTLLGKKWLRQDLRVSRFRDGTPIPKVEDPEEWSKISYGAYTWFENDPANDETYGKIYNGYLVNCCEICPEDWRLPSENELVAVVDYFGGLFDAGQYPIVPQWMSLEGLLGGERKFDGGFLNKRNLTMNGDEVLIDFSVKWIRPQNRQVLENPFAFMVERYTGKNVQYSMLKGSQRYMLNSGAYIKCIQE
ncbi:fibrobacter succinogenes major paralogous domain-containing protein [Algoriphagus limi]|uniref:Fibrobacter succinogenes major paralogous domain-containing protein n=1 Tax=Algoriphagus limi TaxID=2975273 RepID=A0ABT2G4I6_9BACT|nr:fibrobacter succinogenes major paralogous domain-containing protein [Algoriphagus limi]MCS5490181.1 fibrobacter succinogenes major paralogous domain-containing protein [Algoriphagus limi]